MEKIENLLRITITVRMDLGPMRRKACHHESLEVHVGISRKNGNDKGTFGECFTENYSVGIRPETQYLRIHVRILGVIVQMNRLPNGSRERLGDCNGFMYTI